MLTLTINPKDASHVWLASDMHFDHYNIIRYCNRPFEDVDQMNAVMLQSWNSVVKPTDTVICLGDIAHGRNSNPRLWWNRLNGQKYLIAGNHDRHCGIPSTDSIMLHVGTLSILLIHDPWMIPSTWHGWVVHGHQHDKAKHLDSSRKRICVSMEHTDYAPISLAQILNIIRRAAPVGV